MNPERKQPSKGSLTIIENGVARTFGAGERVPVDLQRRANAAIRERRATISFEFRNRD